MEKTLLRKFDKKECLSAFIFRYEFDPINNKDFKEKHILTLEYVKILKQVFFPKFYSNNDLTSFAPYKFKEIIGELNPLFCGFAQK